MKRTETFNGPREVKRTGHYFELVTSVNPVCVEFYGPGDVLLEKWGDVNPVSGAIIDGAVSGDYHDRRGVGAFERVMIYTGANESVTWKITDGISSTRSVSADISDRAGRLLGIVYGSLGQLAQVVIGGVNALVVMVRGFGYGASFVSETNINAGSNEQVVAPASNVNGIILWDAELWSSHGGSAQAALVSRTAAPASNVDSDSHLHYGYSLLTAVGVTAPPARLAWPRLIPAGQGLYFRNLSGTNETAARRKALYTIL